jgi:hypothetical protein
VNIDDQPVGAASGKKVVKIEPLYYDDLGQNYDDGDIDNNRRSNDRPIKPKANTDYNDRDPMIEAEDVTAVPVESFPPGHHPLEGIKDFMELSSPESLNTLSRSGFIFVHATAVFLSIIIIIREYCEQNGITKLIGEYRSRCLYSKTWALREAVMLKLNQLLKEEFGADIAVNILPLCAILKLGVEDKIQQVLFAAITLLEQTLKFCKM